MRSERLAVAALSARWMAQSARRGGMQVVALDLFGDLDTRRAARAWYPAGDAAALRIDAALLADTLDRLHAGGEIDAWIAGPGADTLGLGPGEARANTPFLGNAPDVVRALRDPHAFFALLDRLGIPHPAVVQDRPADCRGWLAKDALGSGGWHIAPAAAARGGHHYFQQQRAGRSLSALFIGDRRDARVIGFAQQRIEARAGRPYVYAGATGPIALPPPVASAVQSAVQAIVAASGLVGLGSFDFLLDGDDWLALEVNPRPSATVELYDPCFARGLMQAHVDACVAGRLPESPALPLCVEPRGTRIVFAESALRVGEAALALLHANEALADVQSAPATVPAGAPLCSVQAGGATPVEVEQRLEALARSVLSSLEDRNDVRLSA